MTDIRGVLAITTWLPAYDRANLRFTVIAGVTVAALVVPKALGYAGIAQVPLQNGLYAAAAGALIYALFGTSRQISKMADNAGVSLRLARVKPEVMSVLDADGVTDKIGRDRFHDNVYEAVNAELDAQGMDRVGEST